MGPVVYDKNGNLISGAENFKTTPELVEALARLFAPEINKLIRKDVQNARIELGAKLKVST